MRISKDEYYLGFAEAAVRRSTCLRSWYGAVVVQNDRVVSTGYNGSPRGEINCCDHGTCKRTELNIPSGSNYELCNAIHAEDNAMSHIGRDKCVGATLYLAGINPHTKELIDAVPCLMCERKIVNMGISRVVARQKDGTYTIKMMRR